MDVGIIIKFGLVGIVLVLLDQVIKGSGKDSMANLVTTGGVILMAIFVLTLIAQLFTNVKTLFQL